jgi:DNA-binding beta-propeller fold protein YncE
VSEKTPAPGEPGIGELVAGYRLEELVGRGGMAVVYRAHDERLGRSVALKVLAPRLALDDGFRRRFIRESRVAASVDHPNIVPIFDAGEADGYLFIAMRFVQGRDVLTVLREDGPLPPDRACHIVTQVAAALDAAHAEGLVHRDVKPANMLRDAAGEDQPDHVYLSDFGLSKHWVSSSTLTSQGEFLGTMDYVAPEQIEGHPVDGRTDQYALACSAFEILTGAPPFRREETMAIMWAQVSAEPPALTSRRPDLPAAADPVMAKALAKAPADRYRTCLEFAAALRAACSAAEQPVGEPPAGGAPMGGPLASAPPGSGRPVSGPRSASQPPAGIAASGPAAGDATRAGWPVPESPPAVPAPAPGVPGPPGSPEPATPVAAAGAAGPAEGGARPERPPPAGSAGHPAPRGNTATRSRRSRAAIVVACVALLAAIGGGYALFGTGSGATASGAKTGAGAVATLAPPGCTTRAASTATLANVRVQRATIPGTPADVVVTSHGYGFVTLGTALGVLRTSGPAPVLVRRIPLAAASGVALTPDQKSLLVAGGRGLTLFSVSDLEHGLSAPLGTLTSTGSGAADVAVSPDGKYAFVTLRSSGQVAVFKLRQALKSGFGPADLAAAIPVPARPAGIAVSPDGTVYVASGLATPASGSGQGWLTVIAAAAAETAPKFTVVAKVRAGCGPGQIVISKYSQDVWVTVGGGNAVDAYSSAKLLSDPGHALIARVAVGEQPLGLVFFDHGDRIVVADSGADQVPGGAPGLALVDVPNALAGRQPALSGTVSSGGAPQRVALYPGGQTLLVTGTSSGQVQVISVAQLLAALGHT